MALQKTNRSLLNKDEEDEKKKRSGGFMLPTFEELRAIEEKAKEDAATAVSSQMVDPVRNRNDLGRVTAQNARQEMLAEHENAVNEQKQKVERAKRDYEAYPLIDRLGIGSSSLMADIARDNIKKQENEYNRMTMTEPEYAKKHKADIGESVDQIMQSAGYGAAKSFGQAVDIASATGAGLKFAGKWLGGEGDDDSSLAKEFTKGFQNRLTEKGASLYDEIDAEYQREKQKNTEINGELNVFAGYVDQAAHSVGEMSLMYWTASMSSALFGGTKVFSAISAKADDLMKSGKKGMQMLGRALGKINAGSVGGAASMLATTSAQSTKEAIVDMRSQNEEAASYGMPKLYSDDEIIEKSALYGLLNGISEVGLEYAIGGITGAAGGIIPKGNVKNPIIAAALSYLKGSVGEGFEEAVQTLASTGLKKAVYDQTAEIDWREVRDSAIVGMITGFGMGAPSFIGNTSLGVSAMRDVTNTAKATKRVNTDAQAGVVASVSAAKAKAYGQMAEQVKNTDSENADTVASIYEWAAGRQQEIADAMADDNKRKTIIEDNAKKSAEDTQAAIQRMRDTNPDFAETERTGRESGASDDDIRMAGDLSTALGKRIRFYREEAKDGMIRNGEYHEDEDTIYINAASKNVKAQIVSHELTHSIERSGAYQSLVNLTMSKLEAEQKTKGKTIDDLYREKEMQYAKGGVKLASYDEITSELVAEFVEKRLLTDADSIKSLVQENRTLGQRIREWFDALLAKMGNASAKEREYIRQMRDVYAEALGEGKAAESGLTKSAKYSITEPFVDNKGVYFKNATDGKIKRVGSADVNSLKIKGSRQNTNTKQSISQDGENVNRKFSVSEDSEGRKLSDGQREYFRDSKAVDENGKLKVMYHGTPAGGFTRFNTYGSNYGLFGLGSYFTDNAEVAEGYSNKKSRKEGQKQIYKVYLNIKNPMDMDAPADPFAWKRAYPYAQFPKSGTNEEFFRAMEQSFEDDMLVSWEAAETAQGVIQDMGYDGVTHIGGGRFHKDDETRHRVFIAFEPEQIKSVDNQNPTDSQDIRYSVSRSDDPDNKRVMPKRSATGTKARARQDQQARIRLEQKVMNRGFEKLSPKEQEHYRDEIVGQYRRKYDDYKKKRDELLTSGYQFAGVDDYVEKVVGSVEDAAIDANTFLIHYQEGVFGDPTREDVQEFALDYLQMIGAHRPDTSETYVETQDSEIPGDADAPPERRSAQAEYGEPGTVDVSGEGEPKLTRKVLHKNIMDGIKEKFKEKGLDLDKVLSRAKDLSTFATVDNMPQRVMEKSLGYKAGQVLSDLTVNQTAKNETEGIRWLNQFTDRQSGVLAKLSKKYNIKPGSKESAAAQMYAEGFYVDEHNEIVEYGDRELAADFPDAQVQKNIKGLAHDPIIRQIYDQTLDAINESRVRNAYPEIQKLDNYYLHFRAMDDTFSKLGIPFNPNDIRAKDLPTDINGVTPDLKPGQPYFASAQHRTGKRTSFDLLGGLERYLTSAKNQIYHIDDIQTLRALRNYVADMYGQANGLEGLDSLDEEAAQERIQQVYDAHLSTFAKFLNEEANVLAGKTSLIDRGLEGIIGRRGITFLNDVNRQVGANMVGWNISSSLTNFLAPVQAFAKMNKLAFVKGFAQTVENRLKSITGNGDDFAQRSDVMVRRRGADRFYRTAWQKLSDPGYLLMGMVDDISTEIIARAKYNELTAKGMDAQTANRETDKWVSRLMGDRSLGQMPQIFNSKMLGLITKFQLEVRNQLDSQFYDTIKEAQADYEEIGDKTKRNAKVAAKVTATIAELALAQHVFGQVFESIAGYNPAFDIIEVIATVLGLDDDEESEDTVLDNIEQGVLALIEDMPYSSVIMDGGRIPISSALPISELVTGEDQYGNEVNRLKTAAEAVPYYVLPGGYGQIKKTAQGLAMFVGDKPVTGSYTDSGNLRFPVEATPGNIAQAAVFGQWASENARDYFDNERSPISEKQAQEFADSGMEWDAYRKYRTDIAKLSTLQEKADYISTMDVPVETKNLLVNNIANRKTPINMEGYDEYTLKGTREKESYLSMIEAGVSDENAVKAVEAVSGVTRTIDKINAIWSTGIKGAQLDSAIKAVVTEKWYERYRAVIDANVPLDVLTWVLDNADTDENDSISNEERTLILSQLAMSREELSALWIASGGSAKSDPWGAGSGKTTSGIKMPEIKMPEISFNVPRFDFEFGGR